MTQLHPFYLIKTIQESFIFSLFDDTKTIQTVHIIQAIKKILDDNNAYFESIWQQINNKKYKGTLLKTYLDDNDKNKICLDLSSSYKSQLLKELKDNTILNKSSAILKVK